MTSKIIEKEKSKQESLLSRNKYLSENGSYGDRDDSNLLDGEMHSHKQSLINLKEYIENILQPRDGGITVDLVNELRDDIKELTKLIEVYE